MPLQVSISGIRGVIGDGLDAVTVARWAAAYGAWLPAGPVVVGRDSRVTGPMVFDAVAAALASTGLDSQIVDILSITSGPLINGVWSGNIGDTFATLRPHAPRSPCRCPTPVMTTSRPPSGWRLSLSWVPEC